MRDLVLAIKGILDCAHAARKNSHPLFHASLQSLSTAHLMRLNIYADDEVGPRAPFGVPVLNPLLNLRETSLSDRILPLPVVFLRLAFSPQLSVVCC